MNTRKYFMGLVAASLMGGSIAIGGYHFLREDEPSPQVPVASQEIRFSNYASKPRAIVPAGMNFVEAAKIVTPGVVHIRSTSAGRTASHHSNDPFEQYFREFFGSPGRQYQQKPTVGTGSGVIMSPDGYIATNNHVVENADDIEILLNDNRTYKAELIGTDPTTDLALLKIEENGLPFVRFGDSDAVEVGEWVLAVGNPFEFRSTVTAGIISAKGRNINILRSRDRLQIESFLQTDAAVNPGNSGGALVNLNGELVGINTAIATPTGSYAGYSFAVPANLANKVTSDLKEFGVVQRALLGINIQDVSAQLAEERGLDVLQGVYVGDVNPNSGAETAGIEPGDVIIAINGKTVTKTAELQEKVALNRPGDVIDVTIIRNGEERTVSATLQNTLGTTATVSPTNNNFSIQGAVFEDLSEEDQSKLDLDGGAKLTILERGIWKEAGIKEGFIITRIDRNIILNVEDLSRALSMSSNGSGILIEGYYENGQRAYYGLGL